jgi:hypothetical protein
MWQRIGVVAVCSLLLTACSSAVSLQVGDRVATHSSDALTGAELTGSGVTDAYEAIQRFRPLYLNRLRDMSLANPSQSTLTVYFNDTILGGVDMLRTVPVDAVRSIRLLSAAEATNRWGPKQPGAVIYVSSRP